MSNWKKIILQNLEERDLKQHNDGCQDTILYLNEKIDKYSTRCEELKSDNFVTDLDNALSKIEQLNLQIKYQNEALDQKETVNNDLIVAYGTAKKEKEYVRELYKKLEEKYMKLQQEMAMSKKTINVINDHILELQFENNMLQKSLNDEK
ncbi:hypothetical protein C6P40_001956 [Pichia californica]|uniref:Autophagy-related protein 16 domain-containing protein n=1 Tax=Pichia californica TaxID=460514 RepID=A0A9P7BFY1_9ASCO|nr:hypothetical protein C6P42_001946 [[Candida] californica]KAG0687723.1 hypothetical protein C6P40_001956 [[Candida] californica]